MRLTSIALVPLTFGFVWLLLSLLPPAIGAGMAVVDWVDVVLEDDICAAAIPVIMANAAAVASQVLNMS